MDYIRDLFESDINGVLGIGLCIDSILKFDFEIFWGYDIIFDECE